MGGLIEILFWIDFSCTYYLKETVCFMALWKSWCLTCPAKASTAPSTTILLITVSTNTGTQYEPYTKTSTVSSSSLENANSYYSCLEAICASYQSHQNYASTFCKLRPPDSSLGSKRFRENVFRASEGKQRRRFSPHFSHDRNMSPLKETPFTQINLKLLRDSQERCERIILHWYFYTPFLLIMTQCKGKLHHFSCLSVIEVASGEYGENVIPSLVKAWKAREESIAKKNSLTSNTSSNMVVSMLPNCNVKTSTDSIIHAASQTTQVSVMAAEWKFKRLANNLTFASILCCGLIRSMAVPA